MEGLWQDLRHGARLLRRNPGFTVTATLALALGIGATSAIFSAVNSVMLRPFPYEEPDRLVVVWEQNLEAGMRIMYASAPNYADWRDQQQVFSDLGAYRETRFLLETEGPSVPVEGTRVTASTLATLGVGPAAGRLFNSEDDLPGAAPVALVSHGFWQSRFGGDAGIVGRSIRLDGVTHTVIGVMPSDFDFPPPIVHEGNAMRRTAELWVPFAQDFAAGSRGSHNLMVLGRLDDRLDLELADAEMQAVARRLAESYPDTNQDWSITLVPLDRQVTGEVRSQLWVLLGAVGFVLLIACVNVANLLLAQGTARRRELAVRSALGAGRGRLARQLFTESVLLALMGGALGLVLAFVGVRAIATLAPPNVPRLDEAGLDVTVVSFTLALSVLTGLLFGMAPLLRQRTLALGQNLREGGRSGLEGREGGRLRSLLVAAEVAASLVLLVGAGLLFQSLLRLKTVDMGLDPANALTMRITLPEGSYGEAQQRIDAFRTLQQRMEELPAVEAAGFIYDVPLDGDRQGTGFVFEGEIDPTPDMYRLANFSIVTPGYFQALGISLRQGRAFDGRDRRDGEAVILVNETLARQYLSEEDPFGQRLVVHGSPRRVIGVVSDVRHNTVREESTPTLYLPYSQMSWSGTLSLVVRSEARGEAVLSAVREAVREFDPALPVYGVKPMSQVLADSLGRERFATFIMALFSAVALLLAAIGIYGVISYTVSRRTRETGIRMALGAEQRDILRLVVGQGLRPVLLGATLGLVAALVLGRTLAGLLYGIRATDPLTLLAVAAVLLAVALLAIVVPARRAARVDPAVALRVD